MYLKNGWQNVYSDGKDRFNPGRVKLVTTKKKQTKVKKILTAIVLTTICLSTKAGDTTNNVKPDTIWVKEHFVYEKYTKHDRRGPYHKIYCDYIVKIGDDFFVNGEKVGFAKHKD